MEINITLTDYQKKKLAEASKSKTGVVLQLDKSSYGVVPSASSLNCALTPHGVANNNGGNQVLKVPVTVAKRYHKHVELGTGMRLSLSAATVRLNKEVIGGFIMPLLAGLAGTVLPGLIGSLFGGSSQGGGMESRGNGQFTHGAIPGVMPSAVFTPPPPAVGRGMFDGRGRKSHREAMKEAGDGMFLHGSVQQGYAGVTPKWTGVVAAPVAGSSIKSNKKKGPSKR